MKLNEKPFLTYKLLNSSFTGLSIGILMTIYEPINDYDVSSYSVGGMILALGMLLVAKFYDKLLNIRSFFKISILVEVIILLTLIIFLLLEQSLTSALLIYCGYQITFIFGNYLVRAETLVAKEKKLLSKIDVNKQIGYLLGLVGSFIFYKALQIGFGIEYAIAQIKILHYFLISLEIIIIFSLFKSFNKS